MKTMNWSQYVAQLHMEQISSTCKDRPTEVLIIIDMLARAWIRISWLWCKVFGHNLVDEGYATPDSGCIAVVCKRCGQSWGRTWLY